MMDKTTVHLLPKSEHFLAPLLGAVNSSGGVVSPTNAPTVSPVLLSLS